MFIFFETDSISFSSNSSEILLLRDHNGNKAYNLLFLCNPYHQLSAIKDIVSYSLVFYCWVYIFLKHFVKLLQVKYTYLLTDWLYILKQRFFWVRMTDWWNNRLDPYAMFVGLFFWYLAVSLGSRTFSCI